MKKVMLALAMTVFCLAAILPVAAESIESETSDEADIDVEVGEACEISIVDYVLPQGGVLGRGETGTFYAFYRNTGAFEADVGGNVSVSQYNSTTEETEYLNLSLQQNLYDDYEPMADYENYSETVAVTGDDSYAEYAKFFTAVDEYDFGRYNATVHLDYSCQLSPTETLEGEENDTDILSIVESEGGVTDIGNQTTDQTFPADVEQLGEEETNETIEGDDPDVPGESPDPQRLDIDIEPVNRSHEVQRGQFATIEIDAQNPGELEVENFTISAVVGDMLGGWEVEEADVNSLEPGEEVSREIGVRPEEDVEIGEHVVPVTAGDELGTLDADYFRLNVTEEDVEMIPSIEISEYPPSVQVEEQSSESLPILVSNRGQTNLTGVSTEIQNIEECGDVEVSGDTEIGVNETGSILMDLSTVSEPEECRANLMITSDQGASSFATITTQVTPSEEIVIVEHAPPFIAIIWTFILAFYAMVKKKVDLESGSANILFVFLMVGETFLIMYLVVNTYGFASSLLPF